MYPHNLLSSQGESKVTPVQYLCHHLPTNNTSSDDDCNLIGVIFDSASPIYRHTFILLLIFIYNTIPIWIPSITQIINHHLEIIIRSMQANLPHINLQFLVLRTPPTIVDSTITSQY